MFPPAWYFLRYLMNSGDDGSDSQYDFRKNRGTAVKQETRY